MPQPKRTTITLIAIACLLLNVSAKRRSVGVRARPDVPLRLERSFAVTDPAVIAPFRLARVLNALTAGTATTNEALFRQWWDTQNVKPGLDATMPHCDDFLVNGKAAHNGFERRCPTTEGQLATKPYRPDDFKPIGVINRFDLADPAGSHCGQYRIIFAGRTEWQQETFHIIFEGALPNPQPERGLAACRPVAQFWADLTQVEDLAEQRVRLEKFFFDGIEGFAPAVHPDHYNRPPAGIRTIQKTFNVNPNGTVPFMPASFFQFRLFRECAAGTCRAVMRPDVLENQPPAAFFHADDESERARRFREVFLQNIPSLANPDVNLYFMNIPSEFLMADTQLVPNKEPFDFLTSFRSARTTGNGKVFEERINEELRKINSNLTSEDIIRRAETQNCVGCHFTGFDIGSGERFPPALMNLQHVDDRVRYEDETTYGLSPAMRDVFIPHRMKILRDFILEGKAPVHSN